MNLRTIVAIDPQAKVTDSHNGQKLIIYTIFGYEQLFGMWGK